MSGYKKRAFYAAFNSNGSIEKEELLIYRL